MCDIEKILKNFEDDLNSKSQSEKIAYLKSYGFQVSEKTSKNDLLVNQSSNNKPKSVNI